MAEEEPVDEGSWHGVANSHVGVGYVNAGPFWQSGVKALTFKATDGTPCMATASRWRGSSGTPLVPSIQPTSGSSTRTEQNRSTSVRVCRTLVCLCVSFSLCLYLSVSPSLRLSPVSLSLCLSLRLFVSLSFLSLCVSRCLAPLSVG